MPARGSRSGPGAAPGQPLRVAKGRRGARPAVRAPRRGDEPAGSRGPGGRRATSAAGTVHRDAPSPAPGRVTRARGASASGRPPVRHALSTATVCATGSPERRPGRKYDGAIKLLAFTDYVYRRRDGVLYGERAFSVFLAALGHQVDELTLVGRLDPKVDACRYPLPGEHPVRRPSALRQPDRAAAVAPSLARSLWRFWRALEDADRVWLLGPLSPRARLRCADPAAPPPPDPRRAPGLSRLRPQPPPDPALDALAAPTCSRAPGGCWPGARRSSSSAPQLAAALRARPRGARHHRLADHPEDVEAGRARRGRDYDGELTVLSVGRVDQEKNPLLLADVLGAPARRRILAGGWSCAARARCSRICARDLDAPRAEPCAQLLGYVPVGGGLLERLPRRPRLPARVADRGRAPGPASRPSPPGCRSWPPTSAGVRDAVQARRC